MIKKKKICPLMSHRSSGLVNCHGKMCGFWNKTDKACGPRITYGMRAINTEEAEQ